MLDRRFKVIVKKLNVTFEGFYAIFLKKNDTFVFNQQKKNDSNM